MVSAVSMVSKDPTIPVDAYDSDPFVALLYMCCDDFNKDAASTITNQDYSNYVAAVVDDSVNPKNRKKVDEFCNHNKVKLIRREVRRGFKAG